jgi:hypothetical protein
MCLNFFLENLITEDQVGDLEINEALLANFPYFEKIKVGLCDLHPSFYPSPQISI